MNISLQMSVNEQTRTPRRGVFIRLAECDRGEVCPKIEGPCENMPSLPSGDLT